MTRNFKDFEKKSKETFFAQINRLHEEELKLNELLTKNTTQLGYSNVDIPWFTNLVNNKIIELSQRFKKSGISMFAYEIESPHIITSSFIGDAIILDLLDKLIQAFKQITEYNQKICEASNSRTKKIQSLQNTSYLRKLFLKLRAYFKKIPPLDLSLSDEERKVLNSSLKKCKDSADEIWGYKLEDNIIPTLVKHFTRPHTSKDNSLPFKNSASQVPFLLEDLVVPDLEKLGLSHLIPQLQKALIEEYKKDLPPYPIPDTEIDFFIPNFKTTNSPHNDVAETEPSEKVPLEPSR